jgi:hypothetical protein
MHGSTAAGAAHQRGRACRHAQRGCTRCSCTARSSSWRPLQHNREPPLGNGAPLSGPILRKSTTMGRKSTTMGHKSQPCAHGILRRHAR